MVSWIRQHWSWTAGAECGRRSEALSLLAQAVWLCHRGGDAGTWASEEIMGLLGGSEPGMWVRQCEVMPHVTQAVPHSAFLGLALPLGCWPSLTHHCSSATPTGRTPSRLPASTPSPSALRSVVSSPARDGGLSGGRSCDPSQGSSRLTAGASAARSPRLEAQALRAPCANSGYHSPCLLSSRARLAPLQADGGDTGVVTVRLSPPAASRFLSSFHGYVRGLV